MIFRKRTGALLLTAALLLPMQVLAAESAEGTRLQLPVDGETVQCIAYRINGNYYLKLRDVAAALKDSGKCFDVQWNQEKKAIELVTGKAYQPVGTELSAGEVQTEKTATRNTAPILLDGAQLSLTAYQIDGNTYFKLRELGEALSFTVTWDEESKTAGISTKDANDVPVVETSGLPARYPKEGELYHGSPITRCAETGILGFGAGQKGGIYLGIPTTSGDTIAVGTVVEEGKETVGGEYVRVGDYIYWQREWDIIAETMIAKLNTYQSDAPDDAVANIQGNAILGTDAEDQIFFVYNQAKRTWEKAW